MQKYWPTATRYYPYCENAFCMAEREIAAIIAGTFKNPNVLFPGDVKDLGQSAARAGHDEAMWILAEESLDEQDRIRCNMTLNQRRMMEFAVMHNWGGHSVPTEDGGVLMVIWARSAAGYNGGWYQETQVVYSLAEMRDVAGY